MDKGNSVRQKFIRLERLYVEPRIIKAKYLFQWERQMNAIIKNLFLPIYLKNKVTKENVEEYIHWAFLLFADLFKRPYFILQGYLSANTIYEKQMYLRDTETYLQGDFKNSQVTITEIADYLNGCYPPEIIAFFHNHLQSISDRFKADNALYSDLIKTQHIPALNSYLIELKKRKVSGIQAVRTPKKRTLSISEKIYISAMLSKLNIQNNNKGLLYLVANKLTAKNKPFASWNTKSLKLQIGEMTEVDMSHITQPGPDTARKFNKIVDSYINEYPSL